MCYLSPIVFEKCDLEAGDTSSARLAGVGVGCLPLLAQTLLQYVRPDVVRHRLPVVGLKILAQATDAARSIPGSLTPVELDRTVVDIYSHLSI